MKRINLLMSLIIILALIIRLVIAWQSVPLLDGKMLLDDAFYGFSIARQIASGHGITYNGIDKTNGMQPLLILLITPVFLFTSDLYLAVNIALTIIAIIDTLVVFLVYKLAKQYFTEKVGLLAAFIWAINPMIFFQTMNGLEVSLYILMIFITLLYYKKIKDNITLKNISVLGVLLGLTFLSRGDGVFLFIVILFHMLFFNKKVRHLYLIPFIIVTVLVVSPWLLYSYFTFGTIQQSSFLANYYASHGIIPFYDYKPPVNLNEVLSRIFESFFRGFGALVHQIGVIDFLSLSLGTIVLIPFLLLTVYALLKNFKIVIIPILFSVLLFLFYAGYFWVLNIRYLTPIMPFLIILESVGILELTKFKKSVFFILLACLICGLVFNGVTQWNRGYVPWQAEIYNDALWINENTPKDAIVASFASGNIIYFSNRTVLGMDGVVDYNAINVILQKKVYSYWKERNVTYWVESSYHNQTVIDRWERGKFDIIRENQWYNVLGSEAKLELIRNRCNVYKHMRGFDMLICFYIMKVD